MDKKFSYKKEIEKSYPTIHHTKEAYEADMMATKLVGERHSKRDFVDLVRWLILDNSQTVVQDIPTENFTIVDTKLSYKKEIESSHPVRLDTSIAYKADMMGMKLVGERHMKTDLIHLVRWLILDKAKIVLKDMEKQK